ncbi:palmitoyltransferase PFA4 [Halteromyces radiatus]|uniref:palmitoyltransferase PFA4 n=1 Tax=Halteromyces radiatus TaxID=101107 RepID=UPI00222011BC|nr:palmitoyltransferase PFA4 [Halteromyces radiatus]KAI8086229.1 palmitoyltransferase PFA4 [Halteromyces radiatus]
MLESIPGQVFVVGVILLISTIAYSSQYFIFIPALQESTFSTFQVLAPFNLFVLMIFYNYYLAVTTDPGRVPPHWEPPSFILNINKEHNKSNQLNPPRFCKSCQIYKPPRTHHCRYCRRCVLKMDHHCPWIFNCVGVFNYPHFLRFVFYVDIACTYVIVLLIWRTRCIMDAIRHFRFDAEPTTTEVIFLVLNFVLASVVLFCVGILSGYHLYCVIRNQSTIEAWERSKVETLIRRGKIPPFEYPFSLGGYRNICAVLGNNPLLWLWPSRQVATGDGISFPLASHIDPRTAYLWPPRDPDDLRPSIFSSKYKRQQERKQQWKQRQLEQQEKGMESLALMDDEVDDSEDYYDSGSFITDSEDDYSLTDEEQNMQRLVSNSVYNLAGIPDEHESFRRRWDDDRYHPQHTTAVQEPTIQYRSSPSSHPPQEHPVDTESDEDDTIPLSSFLTRSSPSSSKDTKED